MATPNRALSTGLPVLLFVVLFGLTWRAIINATGHIAYGLDDPYIHMALAKNVALHGVWGIAPDSFALSVTDPCPECRATGEQTPWAISARRAVSISAGGEYEMIRPVRGEHLGHRPTRAILVPVKNLVDTSESP